MKSDLVELIDKIIRKSRKFYIRYIRCPHLLNSNGPIFGSLLFSSQVIRREGRAGYVNRAPAGHAALRLAVVKRRVTAPNLQEVGSI